MHHCAESRIRAMQHSAVFKKINLRLRATQLSVKFKPKVIWATLRYASLRGVTNICEFLCEFATICKNDLTH
jgi:hypothetical protein